jgi:hypothetical protein
MQFVDSAERLAVQRLDLGVLKRAQPHHNAPPFGIHPLTLSSTS